MCKDEAMKTTTKKTKRLLTGATMAVILAVTWAGLGASSSTVSTERSSACGPVSVSGSKLAESDYNGRTRAWTSAAGQGVVLGYSVQEDSIIYESRGCMK